MNRRHALKTGLASSSILFSTGCINRITGYPETSILEETVNTTATTTTFEAKGGQKLLLESPVFEFAQVSNANGDVPLKSLSIRNTATNEVVYGPRTNDDFSVYNASDWEYEVPGYETVTAPSDGEYELTVVNPKEHPTQVEITAKGEAGAFEPIEKTMSLQDSVERYRRIISRAGGAFWTFGGTQYNRSDEFLRTHNLIQANYEQMGVESLPSLFSTVQRAVRAEIGITLATDYVRHGSEQFYELLAAAILAKYGTTDPDLRSALADRLWETSNIDFVPVEFDVERRDEATTVVDLTVTQQVEFGAGSDVGSLDAGARVPIEVALDLNREATVIDLSNPNPTILEAEIEL
jgi:hypothetical protein